MPELTIELKKKTDGASALRMTRADRSVTWQIHRGGQGRFFPFHDLTHYAVETVLGYRAGFYGLIADGWDVTDFGKPWPRGPLPPEALTAELIVGFLDSERAAGVRSPAAELNEQAATFYAQHELAGAVRLTDEALHRIRASRNDVFARWMALEPGGTLTLQFSRDP